MGPWAAAGAPLRAHPHLPFLVLCGRRSVARWRRRRRCATEGRELLAALCGHHWGGNSVPLDCCARSSRSVLTRIPLCLQAIFAPHSHSQLPIAEHLSSLWKSIGLDAPMEDYGQRTHASDQRSSPRGPHRELTLLRLSTLRFVPLVSSLSAILRVLGEGTFGRVYLARHLCSSDLVALKVVRIKHVSDGLPKVLMREIQALEKLSAEGHSDASRHVMHMRDHFALGSSVVLVLEYMTADLHMVIRALASLGERMQPQAVKACMHMMITGVRITARTHTRSNASVRSSLSLLTL